MWKRKIIGYGLSLRIIPVGLRTTIGGHNAAKREPTSWPSLETHITAGRVIGDGCWHGDGVAGSATSWLGAWGPEPFRSLMELFMAKRPRGCAPRLGGADGQIAVGIWVGALGEEQ